MQRTKHFDDLKDCLQFADDLLIADKQISIEHDGGGYIVRY